MRQAALFAALLAAMTLTLTAGQGQDATLTVEARGPEVVNAVVDRIRSKCVFSEDRLFLRRAAYVASRDGTDSATYRLGYHGGIWNISEAQFLSTQQCSNSYLQAACSAISTEFKLTWGAVQWSDLRKPLYSGLAAALHSLRTLNGQSMPGNVSDQGQLYAQMYGVQPTVFTSQANHTTALSCSSKMDLVFILDASGSVSSSDFVLMKQFAADVVSAMDIDNGQVRVGNIVYASTVTLEFDFDDHNTTSGIRQALINSYKINSGTSTYAALDEAMRLLTNTARGARPKAKKVAVLVTDGQSSSFQMTSASATLLKAQGTTLFAVGVGGYNLAELKAVASDPVCTHVLTLTSFSHIQAILTEIQKSTCEANVHITNSSDIQEVSNTPKEVTYQTNVPAPGSVVSASVTCGILNIYTSTSDPRPGPAVYDDHYTATPGRPAVLNTQAIAQGTPVYITVVGTNLPTSADGLRNCTDFNWTIGVVPEKVVTVICEENGVRRPCTTADVVGAGLCQQGDVTTGLQNPCTAQNLQNKILRHPYPYNPTKFLQCDLSGQYYVTSCPGGVTFNVASRECGFTSPGGPQASTGGNPTGGNSTQAPNATSLPSAMTSPCTAQAIANHQFYHTYSPDNTKFIQCDQWGGSWVMPCAPSTIWSQSHLTCIATGNTAVTCGPADTNIPDPCDYTAFHQCVAGKPIKQTCPSGLQYDNRLKVCNWPSLAQHDPKPASCP